MDTKPSKLYGDEFDEGPPPDVGQATKGRVKIKDRPEVQLSLDESKVAEVCITLLGQLGWQEPQNEQTKVYCRNGILVHVVPSEDPGMIGKLSIVPLPGSILRERITECCKLVAESIDKDGNIVKKPGRPPTWLVDAILERGHYSGKVRPLVGIIQAPTIRKDGTILQEQGYDSQSGLLYIPNADYPKIPDNPTKKDAIEAFNSLQECNSDFPLVNNSDRSASVAMVLSLVARNCIDGCVPLFAITATVAGSGKGLQADVATTIAFGHSVSKKGFPVKQEELTKQITSLLLEGAPVHVFDNVSVVLKGDELDAVLTATSWKDRVLGKTKTTGEMIAICVWLATGNNLQFGSDTARRVLPIRLEPNIESPEKRNDFSKPHLLNWVRENRPRLVRDALTFIRAFYVAGCPKVDNVTWGSFESWAAIIRNSIVWAGFDDPMRTRESVEESDETKETLKRLIAGLEQANCGTGKTVRELSDIISQFPNQVPLLKDVAIELCQGEFNARRFAKRLTLFRGRIVGERRIESKDAGKGIKKWLVGCCGGTENKSSENTSEENGLLCGSGGTENKLYAGEENKNLIGLKSQQQQQHNNLGVSDFDLGRDF